MNEIIDTFVEDYDPLVIDIWGDVDSHDDMTTFHNKLVQMMKDALPPGSVEFRGVDHSSSYNTRRVHYVFHTKTALNKHLVQSVLSTIERLFRIGTGVHMIKPIDFKKHQELEQAIQRWESQSQPVRTTPFSKQYEHPI